MTLSWNYKWVNKTFQKWFYTKAFTNEAVEESRSVTVFVTYLGLHKYKCLNFGASEATEILQNEIKQVINGLNKTLISSNDITVHDQTHKEHDANFQPLLARLQENTLNTQQTKCEFGKKTFSSMGKYSQKSEFLHIQKKKLSMPGTLKGRQIKGK